MFEYWIEINGQKLGLILTDLDYRPTFAQIYSKIREVVRIGANEDIHLYSHEFQITEQSGRKWMVNRVTPTVDNNSVISIKEKHSSDVQTSVANNSSKIERRAGKPVVRTGTDCQTANQNRIKCKDSQSLIKLRRLRKLHDSKDEIKKYYSIVMALNSSNKESQIWKSVTETLKKTHPEWGFDDQKSVSKLFFKWTKFYSKKYREINDRLVPKHQRLFDLLKVVHILDLDQIYGKSNVAMKTIKSISNEIEFKQFYDKHLSQLKRENPENTAVSVDCVDSLMASLKLDVKKEYVPQLKRSLEVVFKDVTDSKRPKTYSV